MALYELARGPLVWIAFLVFILGSIYKLVSMIRLAKKDKVVYPYMNWKFGLRSVFHWLIPFGSLNMRKRPFFTIVSFLFHFCLIVTPLLTLGHLILLEQSWGFRWANLPEGMTNSMTIIVLVVGVIFGLRRLAEPTVRMVSSIWDFVLLLLVLSPFFTGMLAYYQAADYTTIITAHILTGEVWLMAIPFTRISHMLFFPLTRAYMGSEFGFVRNSKDW